MGGPDRIDPIGPPPKSHAKSIVMSENCIPEQAVQRQSKQTSSPLQLSHSPGTADRESMTRITIQPSPNSNVQPISFIPSSDLRNTGQLSP
jgi:hypothetical protein